MTRKLTKINFDIAPIQMADEVPSCKKSVPFQHMVDPTWLEEHPGFNVLDGVKWLEGFYGRLKDSNLLKEDTAYLQELHAWHTQSQVNDHVM